MRKEVFDDCVLYLGDSLEVLPEIKGVHACVTDPPYHLTSIVKRFGAENAKPPISATQRRFNKIGAAMSLGPDGKPTPDQYGRLSKGFMGQTWDGGDIAFRQETWEKVWNALLPGAHLLAFSGTRTYHRMACAIEDAGFEIRDMIEWVYGTGFPKSHDVSKQIDKAAGLKRDVISKREIKGKLADMSALSATQPSGNKDNYWSGDILGDAVSDEAKQWEGWGTALKPSQEPIAVARKPLSEKTVAANVLKHGTGALNIDGCRIESNGRPLLVIDPKDTNNNTYQGRMDNSLAGGSKAVGTTDQGRWPANLIHDGSDEVVGMFPNSGSGNGNIPYSYTGRVYSNKETSMFNGSAARFFYCAKTPKSERGNFNDHPTVKPIALMSYLVRLITPPKGIVLDPFMGSGSTALACIQNGFNFIGIEREEKYFDIACKRIEKMIKDKPATLEGLFDDLQA